MSRGLAILRSALVYHDDRMATDSSASPIEDPERVRRERDLFRRLLELGGRDELESFLDEALDLVVETTGARQGYLEVRGEDDAVWSLSRGCSEQEVEDIQSHISRGIIGHALATGETVVTQSAPSRVHPASEWQARIEW